jgi:hypothetical protein
MGSFDLGRGRYPEEQVEPRLSKSEAKEQARRAGINTGACRIFLSSAVRASKPLNAAGFSIRWAAQQASAKGTVGQKGYHGVLDVRPGGMYGTALRDHDNDTTGERTWVEKCLYEHGSSLQFRGGNCWDETRTPAEINPTNMLSYEQYIERLAYEAEQHEMSPTFEGLGPSMAADVRQFGSLVLVTTRPYIPDGRSRTALNYPNHVVAVALTAALLRSVVSASLLVVRQSLERYVDTVLLGLRAAR